MAQSVDSGFPSLSVELGSWIPILSGIPDSFSCIPDSKSQDSRFHRNNFSNSRILVPLHGENYGGEQNFQMQENFKLSE